MAARVVNSPVAYGIGNLAIMLPSTAFSLFYSFYYIDTLGLAVGLYAIARVVYVGWDAVVQPISGYLSDRTRTRWGRRKPWIVSAIPLYALFFVLLYSVPNDLDGAGVFIWFLAFMLLFETAMAIVSVNYLSLFPELFTDPARRTRVSVLQQAFYIVALLIGTALTPLLYDAIGFSGMSLVYAVAFVVLMTVSALTTRENPAASVEQPLPFRAAFAVTLRNGPFWLYNLSYTFSAAVVGLISSTIAFYAKYVLGIEGGLVSIMLLVTFFLVIPMSVAWYFVVRRLGILLSYKVSIAVFALTTVPLFFAHDFTSGLIAGAVLSIGIAGHFVIPQLVVSQLIDVDAARTGRRREGIYTAVSNFMARTSALLTALAFFAVGAAFGYVSGDQPGPDPAGTFIFLTSAVPLGFLVVSFAIAAVLRERHVTPPGAAGEVDPVEVAQTAPRPLAP